MKKFCYRDYLWAFLLLLTFCSFGGVKAVVDKRHTRHKIKKNKENANSRVVGTPRVSMDDGGNAVAVWQENVSGSLVIKAATTSLAGQIWNSNLTVLSDPTLDSFHPQAIISQVFAVAAWLTKDSSTGVTYVAASTIGIGGGVFAADWSPFTILSTPDEDVFGSYSVTINTSNEIVVTWASNGTDTGDFQVFSSNFSPFLGTWSAPQLISS